jgi:hypothetical protein
MSLGTGVFNNVSRNRNMSSSRLIIKDNMSLEKVNALAWAENWYLHDFNPQTENSPYNKIWITQDDKTGIHYIEDFFMNVRYFLIEGENQQLILQRISSLLDTYSREETIQMFKDATDSQGVINAIYHVGIAANSPIDDEVFSIFKAGFQHKDPEVRKATILSTVSVGWLEFHKSLEQIAINDSDLDVRRYASRALQTLAHKEIAG